MSVAKPTDQGSNQDSQKHYPEELAQEQQGQKQP
jgi:hypothetical protein